jgi:hypothetical protein
MVTIANVAGTLGTVSISKAVYSLSVLLRTEANQARSMG